MVLLAARVDADLLLRRACTGRPRRVHVQLDPFEGVPVPVVALAQMCAPVSLVAVAIVLVLEAGLLIGVVLPAGSLVLGLGVLGAMGVVPLLLAAFTAATGTVLGAALGHRVRRPSGHRLGQVEVRRGHGLGRGRRAEIVTPAYRAVTMVQPVVGVGLSTPAAEAAPSRAGSGRPLLVSRCAG